MFVPYETLDIERSTFREGLLIIQYTPIQFRPIIKGSLIGTIYDNGNMFRSFSVRRNGEFFFNLELQNTNYKGITSGYLNENEGIIKLFWEYDPEFHYIEIQYETPNDQPRTDTTWIKEGF